MQVPQAREILPGLLQAPLPLVAFARARIPEMARARKSWKGFKGLTNREESALVICTRELTTRGGGESCTEVRHVMCGRGESLTACRTSGTSTGLPVYVKRGVVQKQKLQAPPAT